jgi:hypothetical protein
MFVRLESKIAYHPWSPQTIRESQNGMRPALNSFGRFEINIKFKITGRFKAVSTRLSLHKRALSLSA